MRKWLVFGIALFMFPWLMSLVWMHTAGQAVGVAPQVRETDQEGTPGIWAGIEAENRAAGAAAGVDGAAGVKGTAGTDGTAAGILANADPAAPEAAAALETAAGPGSLTSRRILLERDGIQTYLPLEDYLPGVIACQMNPDYSPEALKCQAVIARTYIYRLMNGRTEIHEEELDLDYLGEETGIRRGSMSLAEKEQAAHSLKRCREAVEATGHVVMKYEDRYVLPLFHAVSAGRTRKGEADYPYLEAVDSRWDTSREDYACTLEWSRANFAELISGIPDGQPVSPDQLPDQIQTVKKDDSEYILQMKIGAKTYTGEEIQYALGLPSACFLFEGEGDTIQASVRGSGHGYGLSQAGADSMAKEGWGYEDILNYYYKNISLTAE